MKIQKFMITLEYGEKDDCGNSIPEKTEGEVRHALRSYFDASISVDEIKSAVSKKMDITTDKKTYCNPYEVARGFAKVVPLKVCFRARPEVNTRIMEALAQEFKVYQYVHERDGGVPYKSAYDFYFWCYAMQERDMSYFTLNVHHTDYYAEYNRTDEECERDFQRLREWLEQNFANEECSVCFEWHTEADNDAIQAEASRIYAEVGDGKEWVDYKSDIGRLYHSEKLGYYFKKKGAKKYVYKLTLRGVCNVQKHDRAKAA